MSREVLEKKFDGHSDAKLGSKKNPAMISVQSKKRAKEIVSICEENGWHCKIEVDPKKPEDISGLEILQHPTGTVKLKDKVGRNDPCPCGSGKKYKKCCGSPAESAVLKSSKKKPTPGPVVHEKSLKKTPKSSGAANKGTKPSPKAGKAVPEKANTAAKGKTVKKKK